MKKELVNKIKEIMDKYKFYIIMSIIIFILLWYSSYSTNNIKYKLIIDNIQTKLCYEIFTSNGEKYIHIEDLTNIFSKNIYNDKISGKLILTTDNNVIKIQKDDTKFSLQKDNVKYFNMREIIEQIGYKCFIFKDKLYVIKDNFIEGTIIKNRVEVYDKSTNKVVKILDKNEKIKIVKDSNLLDKFNNVINIATADNIYGYILKSNVDYYYREDEKKVATENKILVKVEDYLSSTTDVQAVDMIAINMYRLSDVDNLTKLDYNVNDVNDVEIYATVNNGQKSSNYDIDILSEMLNSEGNREKIILKLLSEIKNMCGVNIDFGNFNVSDKDCFTQFIKELTAIMHNNGKKVIVNIPSTQYIDVKEISNVADYIVLQTYFARTLASKISGPISSVKYVDEKLQQLINEGINVEKTIIEVPAYTILWTERKGTVIDAQQYSMRLSKDYVIANNIEVSLDSEANQNYIRYTKGITTYKMWLEDEYSINEKTKLVNKYNLAGISIYKSGFELKDIYGEINSNFDK